MGDLELAIEASPDDVRLYLALADTLQEAQDPRGELIALGVAKPGEGDTTPFLGLLAAFAQALTLTWRWGFIEAARIEGEVEELDALFEALAASPSARFLKRIEVGAVDLSSPVEVMVAFGSHRWPTLRELTLGDVVAPDQRQLSNLRFGSLGAVSEACPRLEVLTIFGNARFDGLTLPKLKSLRVCAGKLSETALRSLGRRAWPSLERLELWAHRFAMEPAPLAKFFAQGKWPRLQELAVRYSSDGSFADVLAQSPLRLKALDLIGSPTTAAQLQAICNAMPALERLAIQFDQDSVEGLLALELPKLESLVLFDASPDQNAIDDTMFASSALVRCAKNVEVHGLATATTSMTVVPIYINRSLHPDARVEAAVELSRMTRHFSPPVAIEAMRQLAVLQHRLGHRVEEATTRINLGDALRKHGSMIEARAELNLALALSSNAPAILHRALHTLSIVLHDTGAREEAAAMLQQCLAYYREVGDLRSLAYMLQSMSSDAFSANRLDDARRLGREALELAQKNEDTALEAHIQQFLAVIAQALGDFDEAGQGFQRAANSEDKNTQAKAAINAGVLAWHQQKWAEAEAGYQLALRLFREVSNPRGAADALTNLAGLASMHGKLDTARAYLKEAVASYTRIGFEAGCLNTLRILSDTCLGANDTDGAEAAALEALQLADTLNNRAAQAGARLLMADVALNRGEGQKAVRLCHEAIALSDSKNRDDRLAQSNARTKLAFAHALLKDHASASEAVHEAKAFAKVLKTNLGWPHFTELLMAIDRRDWAAATEALAQVRAHEAGTVILLQRAEAVEQVLAVLMHQRPPPVNVDLSAADPQTAELHALAAAAVARVQLPTVIAYEAQLLRRALL